MVLWSVGDGGGCGGVRMRIGSESDDANCFNRLLCQWRRKVTIGWMESHSRRSPKGCSCVAQRRQNLNGQVANPQTLLGVQKCYGSGLIANPLKPCPELTWVGPSRAKDVMGSADGSTLIGVFCMCGSGGGVGGGVRRSIRGVDGRVKNWMHGVWVDGWTASCGIRQ